MRAIARTGRLRSDVIGQLVCPPADEVLAPLAAEVPEGAFDEVSGTVQVVGL